MVLLFLRVSYCDSAVSVVRGSLSTFCLVHTLQATFSVMVMKLGQNVCFDEISDESKNGSCGVKN